jgi:hypothetical protein
MTDKMKPSRDAILALLNGKDGISIAEVTDENKHLLHERYVDVIDKCHAGDLVWNVIPPRGARPAIAVVLFSLSGAPHAELVRDGSVVAVGPVVIRDQEWLFVSTQSRGDFNLITGAAM